jgi:7-keto-8-aminopelargonate synthetase-like enzyme
VSWIPHQDLAALAAALAAAAENSEKSKTRSKIGSRIFVVLESIYQRTGTMTHLAEVLALKEKHGAYLILDETLSFGTLGAHGNGLAEHFRLDGERVDAVIGSFEHAIAGVGGFCSGRKSIIEHQRLSGAGYCFSACCPPSACAAIMAIIKDLSEDGGHQRIKGLQANASLLHQKLGEMLAKLNAPVALVSCSSSYVQFLRWTGSSAAGSDRLLQVVEHCAAKRGVRVQICSPLLCATETAINVRLGAPADASVAPSIRLCASVEHMPKDIDMVCAALGEALASA